MGVVALVGPPVVVGAAVVVARSVTVEKNTHNYPHYPAMQILTL